MDFWIRLGKNGFYGYNINKPFFIYYQRIDSWGRQQAIYDIFKRAFIVINNIDLYELETIIWANAVLNKEKWDYEVDIPYKIPTPHYLKNKLRDNNYEKNK